MSNKKLNLIDAIKYLSKYIKPHKTKFTRFYVGILVTRILQMITPIIFGIMIDEIIYYQHITTFLEISLVFILISIFSSILFFMIYALHHYLMNMYTLKIKMDTFSHIHYADAQFMSNAKTGHIINITRRYASECMHFVIRNIIHNINNYMSLIFLTVYLFIINWQIGIFVTVLAPISVYVNFKYGKNIRVLAQEQRTIYGNYSGWLFEILSSLKDIRLLNSKKKTRKDFSKYNKELFHVNIKTSVTTLTANNIIDGVNLIMQLAIYTITAYLIINGNIKLGSLIVILAYFSNLKQSITSLSGNYMNMQDRVSYIQKIYDFLESPTEKDWKGTNVLDIQKVTLNFKISVFRIIIQIN